MMFYCPAFARSIILTICNLYYRVLLAEGRKMTDINRRLQYNSTSQKQAKQAAEYLELDRQGKEIEERGQVRMISAIIYWA